ncbi:MAG: hypothetical protein Q9170_003030, partial [Blastenia crenularia]
MFKFSPEQMAYFEKHHSDNKQPLLIAIAVLILTQACIGVFLRFLSRWRNKTSLRADDWLILFALVPLAGMTTASGFGIRYGQGKHIIFVNNAEGFAKAYIAAIVMYGLTVIPTKLSVLYLYHRTFESRGLTILACAIAIVMNVVTDVMILVLPIKLVLGLQLETTRKLQVLGAFLLGG